MGVKIRQKIKGQGQPWWVFVCHKGKRTSMKVGSRSAAKKLAAQLETRIRLGQFGIEPKQAPVVPTFGEYAKSWIEVTVPATCKDVTRYNYMKSIQLHVLPVFGNKRVDEITEGQIKDFLFMKVNGGYSASTVNYIKNIISGVMTKAVDDKVIRVNPATNLGSRFMKRIRDSIQARRVANGEDGDGIPDPLSKEELRLLLDTVQEHFPEDYPLFLLFARSGVRLGEALALRWDDIDFHGRFINLKRSQARKSVSTLKGKRDRRVDMSLQLAETLKRHRLESKKKGMALGLGDLPEYVFTNRKGGMLNKDNWRNRIFRKALKKAGIRTIRIHDLRHTYATLRIAKGDNIADVSSQLGHHSVKLTMDIYWHWVPGKKKSEVDGLDDAEFRENVIIKKG